MIEVTFDKARRLVVMRARGMLSVAEVEAFGAKEQGLIRDGGLRSGGFDLLVIAEGNMVQTQEVMNAFAELIRRLPLKARRFATVHEGLLTRMQSRRIVKMRSSAELFDTVEAAHAWLASPDVAGPEEAPGPSDAAIVSALQR